MPSNTQTAPHFEVTWINTNLKLRLLFLVELIIYTSLDMDKFLYLQQLWKCFVFALNPRE
jgi:hypothetical protein